MVSSCERVDTQNTFGTSPSVVYSNDGVSPVMVMMTMEAANANVNNLVFLTSMISALWWSL